MRVYDLPICSAILIWSLLTVLTLDFTTKFWIAICSVILMASLSYFTVKKWWRSTFLFLVFEFKVDHGDTVFYFVWLVVAVFILILLILVQNEIIPSCQEDFIQRDDTWKDASYLIKFYISAYSLSISDILGAVKSLCLFSPWFSQVDSEGRIVLMNNWFTRYFALQTILRMFFGTVTIILAYSIAHHETIFPFVVSVLLMLNWGQMVSIFLILEPHRAPFSDIRLAGRDATAMGFNIVWNTLIGVVVLIGVIIWSIKGWMSVGV
jgi:hypothetical protein